MWVWSKLSAIQWLDAWEERLYGNPNSVISEIKGGKSIRVEVYCEQEEEAGKIREQFGGSVRELKSRNWVAMSAPKSEPLLIRDRLVISQVPVKDGDHEGKDVLVVPPEMAFGTGDHATTSTCLRYLVDHAAELDERWSFLDIGTGSGVLAMAAKILGAGEVEGYDFDGKAVEVALRNLERNRIEGITFYEADVFEWDTDQEFEVVVANLFSSVLVEALPRISKWVSAGGRLILSGILKEQWEEVSVAAAGAGFEFLEQKKVGKWVSAMFDRKK